MCIRDRYKMIGFAILEPPADWQLFVEKMVHDRCNRDSFYDMVTPTDAEM